MKTWLCIAGGAAFAVCLTVASCVAAGGTFGQRCSKAYRSAALERCVKRMAGGGPLYEENAAAWQEPAK